MEPEETARDRAACADTERIVRSAQRGDAGALEELFRRYLPRTRQIVALRLGRRPADLAAIDDLVQDALLRVFENLEKFDARSEGEFRHWLAACVANSVRNTLRDARAEKRGGGRVLSFSDVCPEDLGSSIFPGTGPTPSAILMGEEALERLETALLALDERDRELIILRRLCEMSYGEIADHLALTEVAARQAFHRASGRLQRACGLDAPPAAGR